ncbi:hypothetical protein ACLB2K_004456 [Fragaria x ananassa]
MLGDLDVDLLRFLALLDDIANPVAEKYDTAETQQALETVIQFLGCDVVTKNEFLDVKRAIEETETSDTLIKDYEEIHHSQDLVQLQGLRTSLPVENKKVLELKRQLAEAEEKVQATLTAIRSIISPTKLFKYSSLSTSVKSYTKKKDMLKRQIDQGKQDVERVKKSLQPLLHIAP